MRTTRNAEKRQNRSFLANLDKLPILPWKSAKTATLAAFVRELDLEVVKVETGVGA